MSENKSKSWFKVNNKKTSGEIYLMGYFEDEQWLSEDITPGWFKEELNKLKGVNNIDIYINSGGGSVFAGLAINYMIKNSKAIITTHIMGLAASTASWAIMPSNKITMPKNALMMLHLPTLPVWGNKNDLMDAHNFLLKTEDIINESYLRGGKKLDKEKVTELLNAGETWLNGQEAYDSGFIDILEPAVNVESKLSDDKLVINGVEHNVSNYQKIPEIKNYQKQDNFDRIIAARKKLFNIKKEAINAIS